VLAYVLWLGILTAVSPCPLATNIAAIALIGHHAGRKDHVLAAGLLYTLGRTLAYVALGVLITAGLTASAGLSRFLQEYMNEALGPILIVLGLILLGWLGSGLSLNLASEGVQRRARTHGLRWALPIGSLFALSFCPVSAGLFFAGLIPLALKQGSPLVLPAVFGIGTALPVIAFAFILAFASQYVGKTFARLSHIEKWVRILTGTIFILAGIYYCMVHIYGVNPAWPPSSRG
jgi:cytochrome c biogenesis protein CcdA